MKFSYEAPHFDLSEIRFEIQVIQRQLRFMKKHSLSEEQKHKELTEERIQDEVPNLDEPLDQTVYFDYVYMHNHFVNDVLPRMLVHPFILALWSLYEATLTELARLISEKRGAALQLSDIDGPYFGAQVEKYFDHVIEFPTGYDDDLKRRLRRLVDFRNAIAHANARLDNLRPELYDDVRDGSIDGVGIATIGNYFVVRVDYADQSFDTVKGHLEELLDRYEDQF